MARQRIATDLKTCQWLGHISTNRVWKWLKQRAGWSRVVPFERGAAVLHLRYIGRDAQIGICKLDRSCPFNRYCCTYQGNLWLPERQICLRCGSFFHKTLTGWHRSGRRCHEKHK